jgi:predicted RNA methylase
LFCLWAICSGLCISVGLVQAQDKADTYKPVLGQMGKDVMWLPTPKELVDKMLDLAQVTANDLLFDLGAGDGVIAITAAQQRGARAVGIEYNPKLAAYAQTKVVEAGVQDKVRVVQGDIFETDFSQATVVTMYLLPEINYQLRPTLLKMKPGTRVVSHDFDMVEWEPDAVVQTARSRAMLWVVPAQVA